MKNIEPISAVIAKRKENGMPSIQHRHPYKILPNVKSKESLERLLEHYAVPFIKWRVPDNKHARRFYVEQIRPSLRFFCKRYEVKIPEWLEGNGHFDNLPPEQHEELFGKEPFEVREFYRETEG